MTTPTEKDRERANTVAAEWLMLHVGNTGMTQRNKEVVLPTLIAQALAEAREEGRQEERERLNAKLPGFLNFLDPPEGEARRER